MNHTDKILPLVSIGLPVYNGSVKKFDYSINIEKWSQNYLQRLPVDLLNEEYLISGNFKIYQKTFQLRIKRLADIFLSVFLLLVTFPIIIFTCVLILF